VTRGRLSQRAGLPGLNGGGLPPWYPRTFQSTLNQLVTTVHFSNSTVHALQWTRQTNTFI